MANRTQFFSDGATVYGASDFIAPMAALTTSGIISGYQVTAPPSGMTVNIAAGQAVLGGVLSTDDTTQSVMVPTNTGSNSRTDCIVLQIDTTAMETTVIDVPGTTPGTSQMLLATVTVPAGASSIISDNIDSSGRIYAGLDSPFAAIAASSFTGNTDGNAGGYGYVLLGNGLALQWGVSAAAPFPAYTQATFLKAFSNSPFVVVATVEDSAPQSVSTAVWNATGFTMIHSDSQARLVHWFAMGPMTVART